MQKKGVDRRHFAQPNNRLIDGHKNRQFQHKELIWAQFKIRTASSSALWHGLFRIHLAIRTNQLE
jgi:hypothetical protein